MFVIMVNYVKPLSEIDAHLESHRRFLDEGYAAGYFLASGPRVPASEESSLPKPRARTRSSIL